MEKNSNDKQNLNQQSYEIGYSADKKKQACQFGKKNKYNIPENFQNEEAKKQYFKDNEAFLIFQSHKSFKKFVTSFRNEEITMEKFLSVTNITEKSANYIKNIEQNDLEKNLKKMLKFFNNIHNADIHEKELYTVGQKALSNQPKIIEKLKIDFAEKIDWKNLPKYLVPEYTCFPLLKHLQLKEWKRAAYKVDHLRRKRRQIDFYLKLISEKIEQREKVEKKPVKHIVDFAGGRGDLSLVIAYFFPKIKFTLIDLKEMTINQAKLKKKLLNLENINVIHGDIFDFKEEFDFAIGLHACGGLIDIIIQKCLEQPKFPSVMVCTCCFGKIQQFTDLYQYPRTIKEENLNNDIQKEYFQLCNFAECETLTTEKIKYEYTTESDAYKNDPILSNIQANEEYFQKFKDNRQNLSQNCKYFINKDRIDHILKNIKDNDAKIDPKIVELPVEITPKNQILFI